MKGITHSISAVTCSEHSLYLLTLHGIFLVHCPLSAIYHAVSAIYCSSKWLPWLLSGCLGYK